MNYSFNSTHKVAEFLLQIKSISLRPDNPYDWASGWKSPIYCDNRKTLSYPQIRTFIRQEIVKAIDENFGRPDLIAGVATGGIAQAALVAQEFGLPLIYVRPSAKAHGTQSQIEGVVESGQSVIVIEDLVSTGNSSLIAVDALREAGCSVKGMVAIFSYNFDLAKKNFLEHKCPLVTLTDYEAVLEKAIESNYIQESDLESLKEWRANPSTWNPQTV
ncbi:orotate phosphoribosyltransferase [Salibacteraceae bacterium]|jgi:orotate phosphoribosyltransferase|nr:orotate phosphoribosyltransferase [Salibacteraceae bacterium]HAQ70720.1 orotate phosphoribosyltransferase [Flavobacteriales bacterium]MDA9267237.1 orotate phosphoribosyltransferase [Salibacteraceae bacterium]MDB4105365.1 orotate phosphoribosyltransferase [Salibacteraceae bacterium]MDB9709560.1 orotate phosphoribosyltransferase [Salibacteraceae bacterium]